MKNVVKIFYWLLCASLIIIMNGCTGYEKPDMPQLQTLPIVRLEVLDGAEIPDFIPGEWHSFAWGFKFEKDGTLSWMRHAFGGSFNLSEGGGEDQGREGSYFFTSIESCQATYDPPTRILTVIVKTDHFFMHMPNEDISGSSEDRITGPISLDGKTWNAKWYGYGNLDGVGPLNPEDVEANPAEEIFIKDYKAPVDPIEQTEQPKQDIN